MVAKARSLLGVLLLGWFGAWLSASAIAQLSMSRIQAVVGTDPFGLIPRWTFFAPNPATTDFHLLRRERLADGTLTEWEEVRLVENRSHVHVVWGPNKRREKALFDAIGELIQGLQSNGTNRDKLEGSVPYRALSNFVAHLPRAAGAEAVQFLVATSDGRALADEPTMLFVSGMHEV